MIAFVVLHYLSFDDTRECVSSIVENVGTDDYRIVIVDNNSPNDSYSKLEAEYKDTNIKLIHNDENFGFARGNNVGFIYAKKEYNPDFIVLCNNDTCLIHNNFNGDVCSFFEKTKFDVMGLMIVTKDGDRTSSPEDGHLFSRNEVKHLMFRFYKSYLLNKLNILTNKKTNELNKKVVTDVKEDVILHGSFMVFSKKYIDKFDGLDPRTYMYLEEDILYLHLKHNNMKSYYNPNIEILHKEDSATNKVLNNTREKNIFIAKNTLKSLRVYMRILSEYK